MIANVYSLLLLAAAEGASEGGIPEWVPKTVNLAIFLTFLYFILRKPMASFFEARRTAIVADLEKAQREKAEAESKLAEVEARLSRLAEEQEAIRSETRAEAEGEHARVVARADEEAQKIAEAAEREIGGALKAARADLQKFVAEKAAELAEATIRSEMTDADRRRIVDKYADQLEVRK